MQVCKSVFLESAVKMSLVTTLISFGSIAQSLCAYNLKNNVLTKLADLNKRQRTVSKKTKPYGILNI